VAQPSAQCFSRPRYAAPEASNGAPLNSCPVPCLPTASPTTPPVSQTPNDSNVSDDIECSPCPIDPAITTGQSETQHGRQGPQNLRRDDAGKLSIKYPARDIDEFHSLFFRSFRVVHNCWSRSYEGRAGRLDLAAASTLAAKCGSMGDAFQDSCQVDGGLRQESRVQLYMPRTGARLSKRVCSPPGLSFKRIPGLHRARLVRRSY